MNQVNELTDAELEDAVDEIDADPADLRRVLSIDPDELSGVVSLETRKLMDNGDSASLTIPYANRLGIVGNVVGTVPVCVRETADEIIVTARILK